MAQIEKAAAETPSNLVTLASRIEQETSVCRGMTATATRLADSLSGGLPEEEAAALVRECRAGQLGTLEDNIDGLGRQIQCLQEALERIASGLNA